MAKIRDSNPKQSAGGFERLVGHKEMAEIFTKAQSTIITNGTELEKLISNRANLVKDMDKFIEMSANGLLESGSYLCTKKVLKVSKYKLDKHEPDFIAFTIDNENDICLVIELKDGDAFDTKKSFAEKEMLKLFVEHFAPKIPIPTKYYVCCFNQLDKEKIVAGFKDVFSIDEVMTGKEFCDILGINYENIIAIRKADASDNFQYVIEKMIEIKEMRQAVLKQERLHISKEDFDYE